MTTEPRSLTGISPGPPFHVGDNPVAKQVLFCSSLGPKHPLAHVQLPRPFSIVLDSTGDALFVCVGLTIRSTIFSSSPDSQSLALGFFAQCTRDADFLGRTIIAHFTWSIRPRVRLAMNLICARFRNLDKVCTARCLVDSSIPSALISGSPSPYLCRAVYTTMDGHVHSVKHRHTTILTCYPSIRALTPKFGPSRDLIIVAPFINGATGACVGSPCFLLTKCRSLDSVRSKVTHY